ncbi:hypothetical protein HDU97_008893, partial [Phlyctochytrium planicorne]
MANTRAAPTNDKLEVWGPVKIFYYISPRLESAFLFTTCVERTRQGLLNNEKAAITCVQNLVRMRQLNFPASMITPHTVYRTKMVLNADSEKNQKQPSYRYRVLAGPDMFDSKTEAIVLFPELLNPMNDPAFKMFTGGAASQSLNAAAIAGALGGGKTAAATAANDSKVPVKAPVPAKKKDKEDEEEPTTPFSHKEYDKGEFIKQFEIKLRTVLAELSDESAGRDPNAAVFKRIIC